MFSTVKIYAVRIGGNVADRHLRIYESYKLKNAHKKFFCCVGDSPEGPLKQPGDSCLKPAKNQNETLLT
jgi:hypothetical protein